MIGQQDNKQFMGLSRFDGKQAIRSFNPDPVKLGRKTDLCNFDKGQFQKDGPGCGMITHWWRECEALVDGWI